MKSKFISANTLSHSFTPIPFFNKFVLHASCSNVICKNNVLTLETLAKGLPNYFCHITL